MIHFILNNKNISTDLPTSMVVLNFLRHSQRLVGTKESCHEGDCGACLILIGELEGKVVSYQSVNSCLIPLADVDGKHIVTIEGLNNQDLTPIQQAIVDEGATQCGYCTPGIVLSLTDFFINSRHFDEQQAVATLDGNLCRCTGYQSIKRAVNLLCTKFIPPNTNLSSNKIERIKKLVEEKILPAYFLRIPKQLQEIQPLKITHSNDTSSSKTVIVAGGTDLWVQNSTELHHADLVYLSSCRKDLKGIHLEQNRCYVGAMTTFEEVKNSSILQRLFPKLHEYFKLIASKPIRYRATVGGNIVNASPIGDLIIFFLALGTSIVVNDGKNKRELALKDFFKGYKQLNKQNNELVEWLYFPVPVQNTFFNFEKVSKRTYLDIASVNSAIQIMLNNGIIEQIHLSAGGVAPIPLYLHNTVNYLIGKNINVDFIREAGLIAQSEISPNADVRGSIDYKRLLLRQLIYAHFITVFPERIKLEDLR